MYLPGVAAGHAGEGQDAERRHGVEEARVGEAAFEADRVEAQVSDVRHLRREALGARPEKDVLGVPARERTAKWTVRWSAIQREMDRDEPKPSVRHWTENGRQEGAGVLGLHMHSVCGPTLLIVAA